MEGLKGRLHGRRAEVFAAAYEEGSLAAAARRLGMSHQAALRAARELEDELGGPLFIRTQWGVIPTALGQSCYASLPARRAGDGGSGRAGAPAAPGKPGGAFPQ